MAMQNTRYTGPTTEEGLIAERQHFWSNFTGAVTFTVILSAVVLALMGLFLA